jgi:hypothetical protein
VRCAACALERHGSCAYVVLHFFSCIVFVTQRCFSARMCSLLPSLRTRSADGGYACQVHAERSASGRHVPRPRRLEKADTRARHHQRVLAGAAAHSTNRPCSANKGMCCVFQKRARAAFAERSSILQWAKRVIARPCAWVGCSQVPRLSVSGALVRGAPGRTSSSVVASDCGRQACLEEPPTAAPAAAAAPASAPGSPARRWPA